jgi:chorismate synthase
VFGPHFEGIRPGRVRVSTAIGLETNSSRDTVFQALVGFGMETVERRGSRHIPGRLGGAQRLLIVSCRALMSGNSFGQAFRISTAGESHGPGNVVIIDGCPAGIALSVEDLRVDLSRRRPGQSRIVTQRQEADEPEILAGVFEGHTTGTSIAILVRNEDQKSKDYSDIKDKYRPGHADYTYDQKYGFRDYRGGGRSSARETVSRVAAGVVAKKLIAQAFGGKVVGYVTQVGHVVANVADPSAVTLEQVETLPDGSPNIVRCPDPARAAEMVALVEEVRKAQDSIGGVSEIVASGVPAGLGEPVFDKLKADLAKALFSLPAVVGVEYGAGFAVAAMRGSQHNDLFRAENGQVTTSTNRHGGMLGGISSGMPIVVRAAVKPTSSLPLEQTTVTQAGGATTIRTKGRHDPCLLPRFVPIGEAMVALVLADHYLRQRGQRGDWGK